MKKEKKLGDLFSTKSIANQPKVNYNYCLPAVVTEVELLKSLVYEYFNSLDNRIKAYLEETSLSQLKSSQSQEKNEAKHT